MYILIFLILLIIIILNSLIKDKILLFKVYSITFLISSILILLMGLTIKYLIKINITFININKISNIIINKFIYISLLFLLLSIISFTISLLRKKYLK